MSKASTSLDAFAARKLADIRSRGLYRSLKPSERQSGGSLRRGDDELISFSCNDYLDLSHHTEVKAAAKAAIDQYGAGAGASRLVTGNYPLLDALEAKLAAFKGTEAACVFGSGFLANVGIIPCFVQGGDALYIDEWAHACIMAGAKLSAGKTYIFRHNDLEHLRELLENTRSNHRHALIVTDGVFSMDGDLAPVVEMAAMAEEFAAWLMTDDAHGIGVLGDGRGSSFVTGQKAAVPLQMGTLSKAIGSYGGYLCASAAVIDYVKNRARSLVFSTGLPPASAGAALAALDIIGRDRALAEKPLENARLFTRLLGLPDPQSPIVPIIIGGAEDAVRASEALYAEGFLVVAIRPPTVPEGTARLRVTFNARHREEDIRRLAAAIRALGIGN